LYRRTGVQEYYTGTGGVQEVYRGIAVLQESRRGTDLPVYKCSTGYIGTEVPGYRGTGIVQGYRANEQYSVT